MKRTVGCSPSITGFHCSRFSCSCILTPAVSSAGQSFYMCDYVDGTEESTSSAAGNNKFLFTENTEICFIWLS